MRIFSVLFGLSMDYEMYLISRIPFIRGEKTTGDPEKDNVSA